MTDASSNTPLFEDAGNERAVLAGIVTLPNSIIEIDSVLSAKDFITQHNKALLTVLRSLYTNHGTTHFDITSVVAHAEYLDILSDCGGFDYINSLFNTHILQDNLSIFVNNVLENSSKKLLYDKLRGIQKEVVTSSTGKESKTASQLLHLAEAGITEVLMHSSKAEGALDLGKGIFDFVDALASKKDPLLGLPTGFPILDERINGLVPGTLTILVARPKCGKSTLLCNWAKHICYETQKPVLYIDTEMSSDEVRTRMLANLSGVKERLISTGKFSDNQEALERVYKAAQVMDKTGLFLHKYMPGVQVEQVSSMCKKYKNSHDISALFFDYIKLSDTSMLKHTKEHQLLGHMASTLKDLAGGLHIPVVSAAQVGRSGASTGYLRADMIADSDRLLRYCNNMLGLCRKGVDELGKIKEELGEEGLERHIRLNGTHRLQILETRAGGTLFEGINLRVLQNILLMKEADAQPSYMAESLQTEESTF